MWPARPWWNPKQKAYRRENSICFNCLPTKRRPPDLASVNVLDSPAILQIRGLAPIRTWVPIGPQAKARRPDPRRGRWCARIMQARSGSAGAKVAQRLSTGSWRTGAEPNRVQAAISTSPPGTSATGRRSWSSVGVSGRPRRAAPCLQRSARRHRAVRGSGERSVRRDPLGCTGQVLSGRPGSGASHHRSLQRGTQRCHAATVRVPAFRRVAGGRTCGPAAPCRSGSCRAPRPRHRHG
jgi:hypothetical protein